jgi:tyrosyl-tRNA synthetase
MDLVRRKLNKDSYALTLPLITKADGSKFGKTAGGAVWIDRAKTSPYSFYQFWLNTSDADVINYLKVFTFVSLEEIADVAREMAESPHLRGAQRRLAEEMTRLVHGEDAPSSVLRITRCLFEGDLEGLSEEDLEQLHLDGMDCTALVDDGSGLLACLVQAGLVSSKGAARKLVESGGVSVNGEVQRDVERILEWSDALFGRFYLVRRGKKKWHLLVRDQA